MLTEDQLRSLADPIAGLFQDLEIRTIEEMVRRIQQIGKLSATDIHRLDELARLGFDASSLMRDVAATAGKAEAEVMSLLEKTLKDEYDGYTLPTKVGFKDNAAVQSLLQTISKETAAQMRDFSKTTGFINTQGKWQPLAKSYQDAVDKAVMEIRTGTEDFHSAMRRTIKNLTDHGMISKVDYESGYSRRLDSSVRNAIMGAQQRLSKAQAQLVGEQFGASGMEITWHMFPRPSHEEIGGRQYSMQEFDDEISFMLEEFNCYHRAFPIMLGISVPTYSEDQLSSLNAQNHREIVFEGRTYTGYEATQVQRRLETSIRREKERAVAFKAAGDTEAEKIARAKVNALQGKYRDFSKSAGLSVKSNRTGVLGYSGREKVVSPIELLRAEEKKVRKEIVFEHMGSRLPQKAREAIAGISQDITDEELRLINKRVRGTSLRFEKIKGGGGGFNVNEMNITLDPSTMKNAEYLRAVSYHEYLHSADYVGGHISNAFRSQTLFKEEGASFVRMRANLDDAAIARVKKTVKAYEKAKDRSVELFEDFFDNVSSGRIDGIWGHGSEYYKSMSGIGYAEAFANYGALRMVGKTELVDIIDSIFPEFSQAYFKVVARAL